MRTLRRVDPRRSQEVVAALARYRDLLIRTLRPHAIVLFGSFATGDIHEGSDVDLVVIADFEAPFLDRIKLLLELNETVGLPLEPVGYTPDEFRRMRAGGNRFVQAVLATGRVLYGTIPQESPPGTPPCGTPQGPPTPTTA